MRRSRVLFFVLSAAAVVALFLVQSRDRSPGPLTPTHAAVPELVGAGACDACHGELGVPSPAACGRCHDTIRDQVAAGTGFHGGVETPLRGECGECHREHHGASVPLVGADAFARAGYADRDAYDHAGLDFALTGRHDGLACEDCHPNANRGFLRPGERRFLGRTGACAECHDDPHRGTFGERCASCHGQARPFAETAEFRHPDAFPLTGPHGRAACEACHEPGTAHAVAADATRPVRRCVECHAADAAAARIPDHSMPGFPDACADCHGTETFAGATFDHAAFALDGAHAGAACDACHRAGTTAPPPRACAGCHLEDYRGASFDHAAAGYPETCADCHGTTTFAGARFDHATVPDLQSRCVDCHVDAYRKTADPDHGHLGYPLDCALCHETGTFAGATFVHPDVFALTGAHEKASCVRCHEGGRFEGTPAACAVCHVEDFRRATDPDHAAAGFPETCADCHGTATFAGAVFVHPEAFPLTGAHARAACARCHAGGRFAGTPAACASCHLEDFRRATDPDHAAAGFPETCADCHGTETFAGGAFRHPDRFALVGGHAGVSCRACHTGPDYRRTPADCFACHEEDYRGATRPDHARQGFPRDCRPCHDVVAFRPSSFRHRFPLETGKHRRLACADCHTRPADFRAFTCTDCHEHARGEMAKKHREVRGYLYDTAACYRCHPTGDEDEAERDD